MFSFVCLLFFGLLSFARFVFALVWIFWGSLIFLIVLSIVLLLLILLLLLLFTFHHLFFFIVNVFVVQVFRAFFFLHHLSYSFFFTFFELSFLLLLPLFIFFLSLVVGPTSSISSILSSCIPFRTSFFFFTYASYSTLVSLIS